MDRLFIVMPAYNEQDNIRELIETWYPVVVKTGPESRLVIVNDGSRDNTYNIMRDCAADKPQFVPLTKENGGHGDTVLYAYNYAINTLNSNKVMGGGKAYVFQTDSDGQTLPEEFWQFWEKRNDFDLIIGHRKGRQDGFARVVVTKVLKLTIRLCFGVTVTDANTPFRLMESSKLAENIKLVPEHFFLSNVILTVIYTKKKQHIKYIPITFRPRQGGVNSINLKKIFKIGVKAIGDFRKINHELKGI